MMYYITCLGTHLSILYIIEKKVVLSEQL